ncbi:MAG: hypothetical protein V7606_1215 [Burkholderiales bacterium]
MSHGLIPSLHTAVSRLLSIAATVLLTTLAIAATGCRPLNSIAVATAATSSSPGDASVMTDSVNYRHDRSMEYTLYDLSQQPPRAIGGSIVDRLATGGAKGCCIALPTTWRPGLKVRVQWEEADREQIYPEKYTRDLEIPRYDTPADLYVVFHAEHEVEVLVSAASPGHPEWQGRISKTPWEQCMESHGLKLCKAVLPKQFDTESSQGFCTYLKEEWAGDREKQDLCEVAAIRCMRDYEDEQFCNKILWGPRRK